MVTGQNNQPLPSIKPLRIKGVFGKLGLKYAKAFVENAKNRASICNRTEFGFYMDLKREFGFDRVTETRKAHLKSMFESLKFKNISFDKFGGMFVSVDVNDRVTFISA